MFNKFEEEVKSARIQKHVDRLVSRIKQRAGVKGEEALRQTLPHLLQSTSNVLRVSSNGLNTIDYVTQKHIENSERTDEEFYPDSGSPPSMKQHRVPVTAEQPDKRRRTFKLQPLTSTSRKNSQIPLELRSLFVPDRFKA